MMNCFRQTALAVLGVSLVWVNPMPSAHAQAQGIAVELNGAETSAEGCRVSFLVRNGMPAQIDTSVFEVAVIGKAGTIAALIRVDFGRLPKNKSRVRQFDLTNVTCDGIARILLNDVAACSGEGLSPDLCLDAMSVSSRLPIEFGL